MTALQPSLAIVSLLLCFCGTLAEKSTAPSLVPRPWARTGKRFTQLNLATTSAEDQSKLLQGSQPNAAQPAPSGFPVPVPPPELTAQPPADQSDNKLKQAANNEADRRQVNNAALKGKDNQIVAGADQANLHGIVKDPSSIKDDNVVQATQTQLPASTSTNAEDQSKLLQGSQPNDAQPAPSGFPVPVPPPELTAQPPAAQSDNKLKQAANKEADQSQVANAALKGKNNQIVAGVDQANLQGIVKEPSSIKDDKVVQATQTQLPASTSTNAEDQSKLIQGSQPNAAQPAPSGFPVPVPPPELTAQPPAAQSDNKLKQAANKEADRRQVANAALKGKDNQIVAGVDQAKLQGIVKEPSSIKDDKDEQAVTCNQIFQKIAGMMSPMLKRFCKKGPAQVVM